MEARRQGRDTEDTNTNPDGAEATEEEPLDSSPTPLSYRRLVWSRSLPDSAGQWCVRYVFPNGSYNWWTVPVSQTEESLYVLGPWASGQDSPMPVGEYPQSDRDGRTEWAGPITEPWEKSGVDLQHCDGCGREWRPGLNMIIRDHLTCCARCWEQIPEGFQEAFVESEKPEGNPSPVEAGIRRFLKAKRD